jgi:hypothetical protein
METPYINLLNIKGEKVLCHIILAIKIISHAALRSFNAVILCFLWDSNWRFKYF